MSTPHQSPVDIPADAPVHAEGLILDYHPVPCTIAANPSAIQVDCPAGSYAELEGTRYALAQFHLHCPSEHTFGGAHAPAALHLVHGSTDSELAVVSVVFEVGPANPALDPLIAALGGTEPARKIDPAGLLPDDRSYVAYEGSLTTPPYTEGVRWRVLVNASTMSAVQLAALEAVHRGNIRPLQPLNDRSFE